MPFRDVTVNELRREFVLFAQREDANISELCRRYGISRTHGYALLRRARERGIEGMACDTRRPHHSLRQISGELEAAIVALRTAHPDWGARKVGARLRALGVTPPANSTITAVLHRHQLIIPSPGQHHGPYHRFVRSAPNDLWQMDFLGHKPMQQHRVHPLTVLDDHSRFGLTLAACSNESGGTVWEHLFRCFERYGLPWSILTDNAAPWGSSTFALTTIEIRLMQLGIRLIHGRPYHPQTQGKVERWHRTITRVVFGPQLYAGLDQVQHAFDAFLATYNTERPHEALDNDVPINHYHPSSRALPHRIEPPCYDDDWEVRKVRLSGEIHYQGQRWRVSESLAGEYVGISQTKQEGVVQIYYYNQPIRSLNLHRPKV